MAQFDVHVNPARSRATAPFVVVIQSRRFDHYRTRLVAPFIPAAARLEFSEIAPVFTIAGLRLILHPLQLFTVPIDRLGAVVASLADDSSSALIVNALDEVLSRAYG
jgi:toxin CcdB